MRIKVYNKTYVARATAITTVTMLTVGAADSAFCFSAVMNATTSSASGTATLTLTWTDTSNTVQTVTATIDATTLGAASIAQIIQMIRAKAATDITFEVAIVNTPTFDLEVRTEKM